MLGELESWCLACWQRQRTGPLLRGNTREAVEDKNPAYTLHAAVGVVEGSLQKGG